ncbi:MAG: hypothetical protein OEW21_13465, partial [Betaproteobacteria bacterium]|nr:hypothetical protein [Betaproteobacteria bacterium]
MPPELAFWLSLALKLALTAGIVVFASVVVERSGPLIGALVVTLPVTVWPAYVFLSLDHDAAYLAASAQSSLAFNAVTSIFMLVYLVLAQTRGLVASLLTAIACWIALAGLVRSVPWTAASAALLNLAGYSACILLSRRFREVRIPRVARRWYELPLRTALVCVLMGAVLLTSHWAGPGATGMLAVYPISTTCTMLILHTRIGGRASAAVIANGLWGMLGIGLGLLALSWAVGPLGTVAALALALAVPVSWNLSVWFARQR